MTLLKFKTRLQYYLFEEINKSKDNIEQMAGIAGNPQVKLMIEKNRGYIMAMEEVVDFISSSEMRGGSVRTIKQLR